MEGSEIVPEIEINELSMEQQLALKKTWVWKIRG